MKPGRPDEGTTDLTQLLANVGAGDDTLRNELFTAVYRELRAIAARKMAGERGGHTLQATALVHEVWLKFGERTFANRNHFFAAAAEAMRQILVDSARRRSQLKRGGEFERVDLPEEAIFSSQPDDQLLQIHEALETLAAEDPLKAEIVKLRYFVGLKHQEIADALEINERTVRRHWEVARVRLFQLVSANPAK